MDVSNNIQLNNYVRNDVQPKVDAQPSSQGSGVPSTGGELSANAAITQVAEGQMFNGQIVDVQGKDVSILLQGNKTLNAHMAEAMNLNIGDSLTFLVKENTGASVTIKPMSESMGSMKDNVIFGVLEQNGISPTDKNYQIVDHLMNNNMPVNKETMQKLMQQSYKFPDTSMETLVALNKLNLPVTAESIAQFEQYQANSHQLTGDVAKLTQSLNESFTQVLSGLTETSELTSFTGEVLAAASDPADLQNIASEFEQLAAQNETEILNNMGQKGEAVSKQALPDGNLPAAVLGEAAAAGESAAAGGEVSILPETVQTAVHETAQRLELPEKTLEGLAKALKDMGAGDKTVETVLQKSETPMQLANNINELLKNGESLLPAKTESLVKELLSGTEFKELLSEAVKQKLTLDGKNMEHPEEVNELYKSMYEKAGKLANAFSSAGGQAGGSMEQAAKGMQERIDFMQNLNQMYGYAQLPVRLDNREMNSDLFVYMNKKRIRESKGDVSALLHLDMDHLGPTDCHVSLHGTTVHTKFYVEDEVSARVLDEHMTMLEKAVAESGFTLTNETVLREPSIAGSGNRVVDEMLGTDIEQSVKRYSFDVRT